MNRTSKPEAGREDTSPRLRLPFRVSAVTLAIATYCLLLLTRLIDASVLTRDNEYFSVIVLQIMIFLLPGFAYIQWRGEILRSRLRMRVFRADHILLIVSASVALMSGGMLLDILVGGAELAGGSFSLYDTFISKHNGNVGNGVYLVLAYAALPAFCEELIFRGIFCAEYERSGVVCASLMSMLFFAMLHFDFRHVPVYVFSAAVLCAVMYATRSLPAAMAVHFLYNLFGLFGVPYLGAVYSSTDGAWLLIFALIVLFLFGGALFCGEAARMYRGYATRAVEESTTEKPMGARESAVKFVRRVFTPQAMIAIGLYLVVVIVQAFR